MIILSRILYRICINLGHEYICNLYLPQKSPQFYKKGNINTSKRNWLLSCALYFKIQWKSWRRWVRFWLGTPPPNQDGSTMSCRRCLHRKIMLAAIMRVIFLHIIVDKCVSCEAGAFFFTYIYIWDLHRS